MTGSAETSTRSFADFFAAEIAPHVETLEIQRQNRLRQTYARLGGTAFFGAIAAVIAWLSWHPAAGIAVVASGLGICVLWGLRPARQHREAVRALFVPPLCAYLGDLEYFRKPEGRFDLERVRRSGIIGGFQQAKLEDLFIGRHRDTDYRMVEARLKERRRRDKNKRRTRVVFRGLLCEVSVPAAFEGLTLLVGDSGSLGNWIAGLARRTFAGLDAVSLDHAAFEARYQVYSDRPEAAHQLLQPGLLDSLLAISDELDRTAVNCAFLDGRFLIALPQRENLFEVGRLHRSLEQAEEDLRRLALEFTIPQRLIDNLHGECKPLLPKA
jgi:hypothetical protein